MAVEKSAGAVIFREEPFGAAQGKDGKIFYLLLHYQSGHWDFPKGNIEKGEKLEETVKRELKEETGIETIEFFPEFRENIKYFYKLPPKKNQRFLTGQGGENIFKIVTFLLAKTETKEVKISWEHTGYKWLPFEEALEQTTFKNAKEILKKANDFILKNDEK